MGGAKILIWEDTHRVEGKKNALNNRCSSIKIARNSVSDCHLSTVGRQMPIKKSVSSYFYLSSPLVLTFLIAAYLVCDSGN